MPHDRVPALAAATPPRVPVSAGLRPALVVALLLVPLPQAYGGEPDALATADLHDDMFVAPDSATDLAPAADPQAGGGGHVIFLNYDGGVISAGGNYESNSQNNTSWVCQSNFTPFGEGMMQDASIQATRADWAAYNVTIVTSRPNSGNYTMNMVGSASCGPNNSGVAPVDCNNENPNDIVFSFVNSEAAFSANGVATVNSQEIAHSFGLAHVNQPADIMNPTGGGNDVSFLDECFSINGNVNCGPQHAAQCGSQAQQNSHAELLALFGPAVPDTSPPTVMITSPTQGQVFNAPAAFDVVAEAADDGALTELRILIDGMEQPGADTAPPWSWPVAGVPVGMYTLEVVAVDDAGNETTSNAVTIEVVQDGAAGDSGPNADGGAAETGQGDGGGGGDTGQGDEGGGAADDAVADDSGGFDGGSGALPDGFGLDGTAGGCGCRHEQGGLPGSAMAWLLLLGLGRRRRG